MRRIAANGPSGRPAADVPLLAGRRQARAAAAARSRRRCRPSPPSSSWVTIRIGEPARAGPRGSSANSSRRLLRPWLVLEDQRVGVQAQRALAFAERRRGAGAPSRRSRVPPWRHHRPRDAVATTVGWWAWRSSTSAPCSLRPAVAATGRRRCTPSRSSRCGGPDGGDGGDGGSIVFEVSRGVHDLSWLADHPHQKAPAASPAGKSKRDGATGQGRRDPGARRHRGLRRARPGRRPRRRGRTRRGRRAAAGAAAATWPSRARATACRAPPSPARTARSKRLARGAANGGRRRPRRAAERRASRRCWPASPPRSPRSPNYPFTTLTPNLGVAGGDADRFVVADIPGLIEGASEGKGLGHRFLRHIVRCRALVLVVDLAADRPAGRPGHPAGRAGCLRPASSRRGPSIVVGTKADLVDDPPRPIAARWAPRRSWSRR